ncbi:putative terminase small subunit [Pseudomonas phage KP1]|uniref:Putative terminase small subunit n=1 Tax=Pseudomonas phage KP1 TaxID=2562463 RepID=A0A6G5QAS2_9CAUD|nr:terminase small subunit [Pseudomonas phage KP1]QBZ71722.1 putative terminase small subunit [Pseudomonas phage KP1]
MTDQNDNPEEKAAFAALLLKERDPFKAALRLFPDNTNRALWVANHWPNDKEVKEEQARLMGVDGGSSLLPSKTELARDIWDRMQGKANANGVIVPPTADEYAKLAKLYAEVMTFIEKPQTNLNVNNYVQRVVEVPMFASPEEWEKAASTQQTELLANARTRH